MPKLLFLQMVIKNVVVGVDYALLLKGSNMFGDEWREDKYVRAARAQSF